MYVDPVSLSPLTLCAHTDENPSRAKTRFNAAHQTRKVAFAVSENVKIRKYEELWYLSQQFWFGIYSVWQYQTHNIQYFAVCDSFFIVSDHSSFQTKQTMRGFEKAAHL